MGSGSEADRKSCIMEPESMASRASTTIASTTAAGLGWCPDPSSIALARVPRAAKMRATSSMSARLPSCSVSL